MIDRLTMTTRAHDFLQQHIKIQRASIDSYQFDGYTVWIKKASKRHALWLYQLIGWAMRFLGIEALMPVPNMGGERAISTEVKRLQELAKLGINVPHVLAYTDDGLMLKDIGNAEHPAQQIEGLLQASNDAASCMALFQMTVKTISSVHQRGSWLSEAFARNIMVDQRNQVAFIDFESDPGSYLPPAACYARDWLLFMFSVAQILNRHSTEKQAVDFLWQQLACEPMATQQQVKIACQRLSWLRKLPVQKFGKDGYRLLATAELFKLMSKGMQ